MCPHNAQDSKSEIVAQVASKFPKFTRRQGVLVVVVFSIIGGACYLVPKVILPKATLHKVENPVSAKTSGPNSPVIISSPEATVIQGESVVIHSAESEDAKRARKQAEIIQDNKRYLVGVNRWEEEPYTSPNGIKRTIRRPVISAVPSATVPIITFDEVSKKYLVEVSKYFYDADAEGSKRLERSELESDPSLGGKPKVEGPFN